MPDTPGVEPLQCPGTCDDGLACTIDGIRVNPTSCAGACIHQPIEACVSGDGCCPAGCTFARDDDCSAKAVYDPAEQRAILYGGEGQVRYAFQAADDRWRA